VNGKMENSMEMERLYRLMEVLKKVFGKMGRDSVEAVESMVFNEF